MLTDKFGPGQADKRAAEQRTAQVGAQNREAQVAQQPQSEDKKDEKSESGPKTAAEKVQQSVDAGDTDTVEEAVLVDPYPAYEELSVEELRSEAESRDVEINRDVEKAQLIHELRRQQDGTNPAYDLMPLEKLRQAAKEKDVELPEEFEKAHLITELRAADTHTL